MVTNLNSYEEHVCSNISELGNALIIISFYSSFESWTENKTPSYTLAVGDNRHTSGALPF